MSSKPLDETELSKLIIENYRKEKSSMTNAQFNLLVAASNAILAVRDTLSPNGSMTTNRLDMVLANLQHAIRHAEEEKAYMQ